MKSTQPSISDAIIASTNSNTMSGKNTNLIQPSDPRYFTQTSDGSYDRHSYRIVLTNGKSIVLEDYDRVRAFWFEYDSKFLSHVEVIDVKSSKGFA